MNLKFKKGAKFFQVDAKECGISSTGLMFTRRENARALIFDLKGPSRLSLTSIFVSFPFIVFWLDKENKVIDSRICRPWKFLIPARKEFYKILEIPVNKKYGKLIDSLDSPLGLTPQLCCDKLNNLDN